MPVLRRGNHSRKSDSNSERLSEGASGCSHHVITSRVKNALFPFFRTRLAPRRNSRRKSFRLSASLGEGLGAIVPFAGERGGGVAGASELREGLDGGGTMDRGKVLSRNVACW